MAGYKVMEGKGREWNVQLYMGAGHEMAGYNGMEGKGMEWNVQLYMGAGHEMAGYKVMEWKGREWNVQLYMGAGQRWRATRRAIRQAPPPWFCAVGWLVVGWFGWGSLPFFSSV